jgi:hypothetical protein
MLRRLAATGAGFGAGLAAAGFGAGLTTLTGAGFGAGVSEVSIRD